jgi:hypothetical protein
MGLDMRRDLFQLDREDSIVYLSGVPYQAGLGGSYLSSRKNRLSRYR